MAKRKGSRKTRAQAASKGPRRRATGGRTAAAGRKTAGRKTTARTKAAGTKAAGKTAARKSAARKTGTRKTAGRKTAASAKTTRRTTKAATSRKATARGAAGSRATKPARSTSAARPSAGEKRTPPARAMTRRSAPAARRRTPASEPLRRPPALDRDRRTVQDDDLVPTPPSTLDLDRTASAMRTGRRGLRDRFDEHTETGPALTGGDVDADWESAYSVGDEAPGGDNPTPDQDIVDDIGRAVGVEYQDNEELKGDEKIASRDRHRWELDPASAEDYDER